MFTRNTARRRFLSLLAKAAASTWIPYARAGANDRQRTKSGQFAKSERQPTVGIALGAGGANGLAHILMLEALDELGVKPHCIAGSSIGAVVGALYASGITGRQIRELVAQFIISPGEQLVEEFLNEDALRWVEFIEIDLGRGGLLSSEGFISFLYDTLKQETFEQLKIPLKITAADLWSREQIVMQSGSLLPAIKASMALPGVFRPVLLENRVLIDGGTVNPVPYDLLTDECDVVIGIDVVGVRTKPKAQTPGYFETIFNAAKVMQQAIMSEKLRHREPDIYIVPNIVDIRALEFYHADQVFAQAGPAKQELKRSLVKVLKL